MAKRWWCVGGALLGLSACATPEPGLIPPAPPPLTAQTFAGQAGSARGNYPGFQIDETYTPRPPLTGPCAVFVWDRPLPGGWALRAKSASCPDPGKPGFQLPVDLGQSFLPLSDSTLAHGWDMPPEPDHPPTAPGARLPKVDTGS
ncbi:hypothetical protein UAJ10_13855 [Nitrospirillum sp. BR 11164]|uniref:hypothetical protein n=1 Tax=Nitrospirillum sp. BR 11164 TaxID=3104324 RepID=UPI002B0029E0|nr:hypothetical protein [Nitrospirillum sp. BR 11164]MEA1650090.1 hypothetical protein [Nitrospirillum sp. BR 11164]